MLSPDVPERLRATLDAERERLLKLDNVIAVGAGYKETGGRITPTWAILVFVWRKVPPEQLAPGQLVPQECGGYPTDVIEVGEDFSLLSPGGAWEA